jgi:Amt family ammonium transporter
MLAFSEGRQMNQMLLIAVNTTLSAAAGAVIATIMSWLLFGKPDLSMCLNGALGGLVGITAGCDAFSNLNSMFVGGVAGALVVAGVIVLDKLQIDDPVGAFPVHGVCGVWACLALGMIPNAHLTGGSTSFVVQLIGTAAICAWSFATMFALFSVLKAVGMLRVSAEEEARGLDICEHGMRAYALEAA